jgi:chemotaxis protein CheD
MRPARIKKLEGTKLDGKYAEEAMELFMLELGKRHTSPSQYVVHVYGGGNMFENESAGGGEIGKQNIEAAHFLLDDYGFTMAYDHLGSFGHRKLAFDVWSGAVRMKHIDCRKNMA